MWSSRHYVPCTWSTSRKVLIFVACPCGNPLWSSSITSLKTPSTSTSHRSWTLSFNFLPVGHWVHSTHYYCSWSVLTYALDPISTGSGSLFWSCRSPEWSLHTGAGSIFTSLNDLPVSIFQFTSFPCNFSDASGFRIPECCEMLWQIVGSILLLLTYKPIDHHISELLVHRYLYIVRLTHTGLRWTHPVPYNLGSFNKGISF